MNRETMREFQPGIVEMDVVNPTFLKKGLVFHYPTHEDNVPSFAGGQLAPLTPQDHKHIDEHCATEDRYMVALGFYDLEKAYIDAHPDADRSDLEYVEQMIDKAQRERVATNKKLVRRKQAGHPYFS